MKKYINLILLCALLLLFSCKENADLTMEQGIHFYKTEKYSDAMQAFNDVIYELEQLDYIDEIDRKLLARAYYNLGLTYSKVGDFNKAEYNLNAAIQLNPLEEFFIALSLIQENSIK
tara:strand:+ start:246 stop:596 length:351 start_codon:yes stop_codon:yes gene_type:complete